MGLRGFFGRLFKRQPLTPLEEAREAARALSRRGHGKRRRRPPRPDERDGTGPWGGNGCGSAASFDSDSSGHGTNT